MDSYITVGVKQPEPPEPDPGMSPEIGDTLEFIPHALWMSCLDSTLRTFARTNEVYVTGVCCYINRRARWARYVYLQPDGSKAWECFKY